MKPYILQILEENLISRSEFAAYMEINRDHLEKLISGKHKPQIKTVRRISFALAMVDGQDWRIHAHKLREVSK